MNRFFVSFSLFAALAVLASGVLVSFGPSGGMQALTIYLKDMTPGTGGDVMFVDDQDRVYVQWVDKIIHAHTQQVLKDHNAAPVVEFVYIGNDSGGTVPEPEPSPEVIEPLPEYIACPLVDHEIVIDLTVGGSRSVDELLRVANKDISLASLKKSVLIPPGMYEVRLASFSSATHPMFMEYSNSTSQRWFLSIQDGTGREKVRTVATRDLSPGEGTVIELVERDLMVPDGIAKAVAVHAAYPASSPHPLVPLCIAFDSIAPVADGGEDAATTSDSVSVSTTTTTTVATTTTNATVETTSTNQVEERYHCAFDQRSGRTIVDLTRDGREYPSSFLLRSNRQDRAVSDRYTLPTLAPGTYVVRYMTYRDSEISETDREYVRAVFRTKTGDEIVRAGPSRDIPSFTGTYVSKAPDELVLRQSPGTVELVHDAYPSTLAHPVVPLCLALDLVTPLAAPADEQSDSAEAPAEEEPEAVPNEPISTPSPTPTQQEPRPSAWITRPTETRTVDTAVVVKEKVTETQREVIVGRWQDDTVAVDVSPDTVGLGGALREVVVPDYVVPVRSAYIARNQTDPFADMKQAPQSQRERILNELVLATATSSHATSTAATTSPMLSLARSAVVEKAEPAPNPAPPRMGLASLRDTDGDGLTDFDEVHIYKTDPESPFTAGSILSDGERVLLGLDPTKNDYVPVPVESPKSATASTTPRLSIDTLALVETNVPDPRAGTTTELKVSGRADPYSFVTMFVFSTPIVMTVQADASGRYEYRFEQALEDGSHEVYVTTVNNAGRIVAKSEPIPFIKTAQAIEYTPLTTSNRDNPVVGTLQMMLSLGLLLLLVIAIATIVWIGNHRSTPEQRARAQSYE